MGMAWLFRLRVGKAGEYEVLWCATAELRDGELVACGLTLDGAKRLANCSFGSDWTEENGETFRFYYESRAGRSGYLVRLERQAGHG